jgi:hypothetical protein
MAAPVADTSAPTASVVRIRRKGGKVVVGCDVYIGRAMTMGGWKLTASKWANPYKVVAGDRAAACAQYEAYVRASPDLMASLDELDGKVLGCWCKPEMCHGDVLLRLLGERAAASNR